jgi:putative ABC transport system ATP-binding protein
VSEPGNVPQLEIQGLGLSFGQKSLWESFSLTLEPGEKVAVVGRSGSGKSSLLKCILGFVTPSSGRICVRGEELLAGTVWSLRRSMGYVPQEPDLGTRTAQDFLRVPFGFKANRSRPWQPERLQSLCRTFQLDPGLLAQPVRKLSGGEKQRVALISALLLERDLYLFDEVTSALDEEARAAAAEYFRAQTGLSALFVAHDPELRAICDRVIALTPTGNGGEEAP